MCILEPRQKELQKDYMQPWINGSRKSGKWANLDRHLGPYMWKSANFDRHRMRLPPQM